MSVPTFDKAIESIEILNNIKPGNINEASSFLTELQQSNYAWMIADQLLYTNKDIYTAYFGAQTMRTKIQLHFEELPIDSHISLKESVMKHLLSPNSRNNPTVSKQLCLAIADLFCHMVQWKNSLPEIIHIFSQNADTLSILLDILKYIPEEFSNKSLRLGVNRKTEIFGDLEQQRLSVVSIIEQSLSFNSDAIMISALDSLNAWFVINIFRDSDLHQSKLISLVYEVLERPNEVSEALFKAAVQCASDFFCHNVHRTPGLIHLFQERTYNLEAAYRLCESNRPELCLEYAKVFCEMAAALLPSVIASPRFDNASDLGDVRTLHMLLITAGTRRDCCAYVLDVLTDVSEQNDCPEDVRKQLEPIFEELIAVMTRHCAATTNNDEEQSLADFRADVFYVMEQIRVFVDIESIFRKMLSNLSQLLSTGGNSINEAEAIICLISSIVKFVDTSSAENSYWTEQLLTAVILPHIRQSQPSFKSVSFTMFGELCRWSSEHPQIQEHMLSEMAHYIINTTLQSDDDDNLELSAIEAALRSLSTYARRLSTVLLRPEQWQSLVMRVCEKLPLLSAMVPKETVAWYEALGRCLCVPHDMRVLAEMAQSPQELAEKLWYLVKINVDVVGTIVTTGTKSRVSRHVNNPSMWLDNISALFVSMNRLVTSRDGSPSDPNREPYLSAVYSVFSQYMWPTIASLIDIFIADGHVLERVVRILRYSQRALERFTKPLLAAMADKVVSAYSQSRESCFIYMAGVLVDEFGRDADCRQGLVGMFHSLSVLALADSAALDTNTTEDLFRLMVRLVQHCAAEFLSWNALELDRLLDLALSTLSTGACKVDTKMIGLRLFVETLDCVNTSDNEVVRGRVVAWLIDRDGLARLLTALLYLCRWNPAEVLDEELGSDMADLVVYARKLIDQDRFLTAFDGALHQVGVARRDGLLYATEEQIARFRNDLLQDRQVLRGLEDFAKLFT